MIYSVLKTELPCPKSNDVHGLVCLTTEHPCQNVMTSMVYSVLRTKHPWVYSAHDRHAPVHVCVVGSSFGPTQATRNKRRFPRFASTKTQIVSCGRDPAKNRSKGYARQIRQLCVQKVGFFPHRPLKPHMGISLVSTKINMPKASVQIG